MKTAAACFGTIFQNVFIVRNAIKKIFAVVYVNSVVAIVANANFNLNVVLNNVFNIIVIIKIMHVM